MKLKPFLFAALLLFALAGFAHEPLKSAAADAMKKGEFEKALTLFAEEIKASPEDARLKKLFSGLKAHLRHEKAFAQESDPATLAKLGKQVRAFYYQQGLFDRAEAVDRKLYETTPSTENAVSYGVTLLNLNKNKEAVDLFAKTDLKDAKSGSVLCAALAFARVGDKAKAAELCARVPVDKMNANELKLYARIAALNGDGTAAADAARRILEQAQPKQHDSLKKQYFTEDDFKKVADLDVFRKALETKSKAEDDCTGCPNRGTSKCDGKHNH